MTPPQVVARGWPVISCERPRALWGPKPSDFHFFCSWPPDSDFDRLWPRFGGGPDPQNPLKTMVFLRCLKVFCISALFAYVGSWASFLEPLGSLWDAFSRHVRSKFASWAAFCFQSRPPGGPFGLQVGVLGGLWASWSPSWPPESALGLQLGVLGRILTSKLASWASFGPPTWPPGPAFGLQVGILVWLWASKLACWAAFGNRPFEFEFFDHIYLRRNGGMRGAFE